VTALLYHGNVHARGIQSAHHVAIGQVIPSVAASETEERLVTPSVMLLSLVKHLLSLLLLGITAICILVIFHQKPKFSKLWNSRLLNRHSIISYFLIVSICALVMFTGQMLEQEFDSLKVFIIVFKQIICSVLLAILTIIIIQRRYTD